MSLFVNVCDCFPESVRVLASARMHLMSVSACECLQILVALHRKHHRHVYAWAGKMRAAAQNNTFGAAAFLVASTRGERGRGGVCLYAEEEATVVT